MLELMLRALEEKIFFSGSRNTNPVINFFRLPKEPEEENGGLT